MTGRHYRWQRRWVIDPVARTLTHDTGLILRATPDGPGEWELRPQNLGEWKTGALKRMDPLSLIKHVKRLMSEAAELWNGRHG